MATRSVIVEMEHNRALATAAFSTAPVAERALDLDAVPEAEGVAFDPTFAPTYLPGIRPRSAMDVPYVSGAKFELALDPEEATYIVRAEVEEERIDALGAQRGVVGVYADVQIQPAIICPSSPPLGNDGDVERLLCVSQMHGMRMDGTGVLIAIVDTGINLAYLASRGKNLTLDVARSWTPLPGGTPGAAPVDHGTMCAFDAAIAAPKATFLDIQLLRPLPLAGVLSDAVRAYSHLATIMTAPTRPGENRSLVVSNSWGMFHPSWDFPVGHPGNYSDNPNHPFNRIVAALEQLGADILFAAGNCGADCPDRRCQGVTANAIYGANSHPSVLSVAGVDTTKQRVGYSSQGPGRLARDKPDLAGYTHFQGSGVYAADGGTSAATPVVAGVVAAVRTKRPYAPGNPAVSPAAIRALMRSTAEDLGSTGFDFDHGFGVVGGCALYERFRPRTVEPIDLCRRFPWICRPRPIALDFCRRFPEICRGLVRPPVPPIPPIPDPGPLGVATGTSDDLGVLIDAAYQAGYYDGQQPAGRAGGGSSSGGCSCGEGSERPTKAGRTPSPPPLLLARRRSHGNLPVPVQARWPGPVSRRGGPSF